MKDDTEYTPEQVIAGEADEAMLATEKWMKTFSHVTVRYNRLERRFKVTLVGYSSFTAEGNTIKEAISGAIALVEAAR